MTTDKTDVLIIGSGLAGLYTALHIDPRLSVHFVTKDELEISNSWLAQGGIAAAVSRDDTPVIHMEDTQMAGAGLCDPDAVRVLVDEGPDDIRRLREMNVPFDVNEEGDLAITREGGHTRNRVVHAGGDATGRETVKVLSALAASRPNVSFWRPAFLVRLLTDSDGVCGALLWRGNEAVAVSARYVILATGGVGQCFTRSTNPAVATGDGIATALMAGAALRHMEFIQFHPSGLYDPSTPGRIFLISEAVRGEGAYLVNDDGERFMQGQHPMAELAPRDIVARGIIHEMAQGQRNHMWLDATHIPAERLTKRFPTIYKECLARGIDITTDRIPVAPTQHYMVGGVETDLHARCTVPHLFAVGETACTGVHGANRLASNSMLECLVYGRRAAEYINGESREQPRPAVPPDESYVGSMADFNELAGRVRILCDQTAGVIRTESGLRQGLRDITALCAEIGTPDACRRDWCETHNIALTAKAIIGAALSRKESCGAHYLAKEEV